MAVEFFKADYGNTKHGDAIVSMLDAYAHDPMGGSEPLSQFAKDNLVNALNDTPGAFSVLGQLDGEPVALANCFRTLSTFACQPIINIHDMWVASHVRGQGLSQGLLNFVEAEAVRTRCCKVTLEVLEGNDIARAAYAKFGFAAYTLDEKNGHALFLQKKMSIQ